MDTNIQQKITEIAQLALKGTTPGSTIIFIAVKHETGTCLSGASGMINPKEPAQAIENLTELFESLAPGVISIYQNPDQYDDKGVSATIKVGGKRWN
jgi:hypothetical protein